MVEQMTANVTQSISVIVILNKDLTIASVTSRIPVLGCS